MLSRRVCTGHRVILSTCLMLFCLATSIKSLPSSLTNEVTLDEGPGTWSEWEEWSPCTRSCGAGITTQNRTCLRGNCVGPSVQYMSCCIQECSSDQVDFRAEQCLEYNDGNDQWMPATEDNKGCSLRCINSVTGSPLLSFITSGTSCKTVEGFNGVCLEKMCARVGCDGVLGSDKIEDRCHQCHSPGSEPQYHCQRFSAVNTPNQAAMNGNLAIMTIPQGATTITISHVLLPGEGMLALKSSFGTYYYSRGMVESLKDIAGTEFHRRIEESGEYPKEVLFSRGPISERITVELTDVYQSAPMVEHEYYIVEQPDTITGPHANHTVEIVEAPTDAGSEYAWLFNAFSECSVTCGTGVKIATANCRDLLHPERLDIPDGLCRHLEAPKPFPLLQKCHIQECQPSWIPGEWSECSARCGNGTQTRHLMCHRFLEEGKAAARVSSSLCVDSEKPEMERVCSTEPCYAQWSTGPWSECPSKCGRWEQVRNVVCREMATGSEVNSTLCNHTTDKPPERQTCIVPCAQCYWYTSKFGKCNNACGYGTQTRRLRCRYIANNHRANESCCENLPPPNTTQPCYDTRRSNCNPDWITYQYGECRGDCTNCSEHAVMTKERKVVCGAVASGELVEFPDKECNTTAKPLTRMPCVRTDCPQWRTSDWGECNTSCGDGNRYRDVYCASADGRQRLTDDQCRCMPFKPSYIQSCPNLPSCPTTSPVQCTANLLGDEVCDEAIQSPCGSFEEHICCKTCKEIFSSTESMATI